jgi:HAD superfamily hydrolase (TIGR01509 family)
VFEAIVFDMDGVIVESEQVWDEVRQVYVEENGGQWSETASRDQMGMSTPEWSAYLVEQLGVPGPPEDVAEAVIARVTEQLGDEPPLIDGAVEAVRTVAARWTVGLASSSPPQLIAAVLAAAGIADLFAATVSSEEVPRGKPAPDVYLEACRQIGVDPARAAAIEDSSNGIRSAAAAGLAVIAVPNRAFPPADDALAMAARVLDDVGAVPEQLEKLH